FFQAEDGIRDFHVTGVQTCALPISYWWYEEQKEGLGEDFLTELESCFSKLKSHPQYFGKFKKNFRQVVLKRFPYVVVFEIIKIRSEERRVGKECISWW